MGACEEHGFTIVTKDSDFEARSILSGSPPKLIWIRARNCTSAEVESFLRAAFSSVKRFIEEDEETCLILGPRHANK
jgi:predicted nuclease of predicted toxin-antitoxin system